MSWSFIHTCRYSSFSHITQIFVFDWNESIESSLPSYHFIGSSLVLLFLNCSMFDLLLHLFAVYSLVQPLVFSLIWSCSDIMCDWVLTFEVYMSVCFLPPSYIISFKHTIPVCLVLCLSGSLSAWFHSIFLIQSKSPWTLWTIVVTSLTLIWVTAMFWIPRIWTSLWWEQHPHCLDHANW